MDMKLSELKKQIKDNQRNTTQNKKKKQAMKTI